MDNYEKELQQIDNELYPLESIHPLDREEDEWDMIFALRFRKLEIEDKRLKAIGG